MEAVPNYVEPFFGSGAVLLERPHDPGIETVNDRDCMVANFWRALQHDPDEVAYYADSPVNEVDQHARHMWLCSQEHFREAMKTEPDFYDSKIAGWWVWGQCIWIGSGWCATQRPHLGNAGTGVHRKLPHLGDAGRTLDTRLHARTGRTNAPRAGVLWRLVAGGVGLHQRSSSVLLESSSIRHTRRKLIARNFTARRISASRTRSGSGPENGNNPDLRIALCGYEGEHQMPDSWEFLAWKARGGMARRGPDVDARTQEGSGFGSARIA